MDPFPLHYAILPSLLVLSAFFSLSETSFTATSSSKVHKLKGEGYKNAARLSTLLQNRERLISFILFGNNTVNIFASSLATVMALEYFASNPVLAPYSSQIASVAMTFFVLIFAEILPKMFAINYAEHISLAVTGIYTVLLRAFGPFVECINTALKRLVALFGFRVSGENIFSAYDVIRGEIEYLNSKGSFAMEEDRMLGGILDLEETSVESIMTHRKDVDMVDIQSTVEEIVSFVNDSGHTRIPFYDGKSENIIGVLHLRDFFVLMNRKSDITTSDIRQILLPPIFVSSRTRLRVQLFEFKKRRNHIAIVVDEYGAFMGIVTLEDIIEEIVGSIEDEHDESEKPFYIERPGVLVVNGECLIRDFNRETGLSFHNDEASTMAGLVLEVAEKIPDENESFIIDGHRFTVLKKDLNKISYIRLEKLDDELEDESS